MNDIIVKLPYPIGTKLSFIRKNTNDNTEQIRHGKVVSYLTSYSEDVLSIYGVKLKTKNADYQFISFGDIIEE